MKKISSLKSILIFVTAVVILYSQEEPDPESFFPADVGNVWEYGVQTDSYKTEIIRDSVDDYGNRFLFYTSYFNGNRALYKMDTLYYNVYSIHSSIDTILYYSYRLDADSGETWKVREDPPGTLARVDSVYTVYLWGEERYVKEIGFYRPPPPFDDTVVTEDAVVKPQMKKEFPKFN